MELMVAVVALVVLYVAFKTFTPKAHKPGTTQPTTASLSSSENENAAAAIQKVIDACMANNESAMLLLSIVASTDGRISRDELKIIAAFCMKHGAVIENSWMQSINKLNAGVNMKVAGDRNAGKHLAALQGRPIVYLASLYGAVVALTIARNTLSGTSRDVVEGLEQMIEQATAPQVATNQ